MIGSALIIGDVLLVGGRGENNRQAKLKKTYYRLMLVMSIYDFFYSTFFFLSSWPMPSSDDGDNYDEEIYTPAFSYGTKATCTLQGFMAQFTTPGIFYNAYLAIYYVMKIVWNWSDAKIIPFEYTCHIMVLFWSCVTSFTALALGHYGSNGFMWCYMPSNIQGLYYNVSFQWIHVLIAIIFLGILCRKIRKQFRTNLKYGKCAIIESQKQTERGGEAASTSNSVKSPNNARGGRCDSNSNSNSNPEAHETIKSRKQHNKKKNPMNDITTQAALYTSSYLFTECPNFFLFFYTYAFGFVPFWVIQFMVALLPLQGKTKS